MDPQREKSKVYSALNGITKFYHFAPLDGELGKKVFHKNLTLMFLSYILDKNHLLVGEPGWGKTTSAKIISAKFSGLPYDLYDSLEIRGNPQKYEEKIVGRPHYGKLSQGVEDVVWQGTFGLDAIVVDEVNRLPYETQDVILQGIDTGRWNYQNESLYEGKKPTFMTMNEREDGNGLFAALNDRLDIVTEEKFFSTLPVFGFGDARKKVETDLCKPAFTQEVLDALKSDGFTGFKKKLQTRILESYLTPEEKKTIREEIGKTSMDNDAWLFLQSFMAEINYSYQYGCKRATDPTSPHTHDQHYVGIHVRQSFDPRSVNATLEYAKGLVWFLSDKEVGLDHIKFILPHVFAHKVVLRKISRTSTEMTLGQTTKPCIWRRFLSMRRTRIIQRVSSRQRTSSQRSRRKKSLERR